MSEVSVRPVPSMEPPSGFHLEAYAETDGRWRLASEEEFHTRVCRHSNKGQCRNRVVAGLNRRVSRGSQKFDSWWFYCDDHMFGRWVEGGHVMHWIAVKDEA